MTTVFAVAPDRQQEAVDLLIEATDKHIKHLPGFISANFHVSDERDSYRELRAMGDPRFMAGDVGQC